MNKEFIEELIRQVIDEMSDEEEVLTQETNVTGDVAGFDAPLTTKKLKRKFDKDEESV